MATVQKPITDTSKQYALWEVKQGNMSPQYMVDDEFKKERMACANTKEFGLKLIDLLNKQ